MLDKLIYIYNVFFNKKYTKEMLYEDAKKFKSENDFLKFKLFAEVITAIYSNYKNTDTDEEKLATIFLVIFLTFFSPTDFEIEVIKNYLDTIFKIDFNKIVERINYNYDNEKYISRNYGFSLNCLILTLFSSNDSEEEFKKRSLFVSKLINENEINKN